MKNFLKWAFYIVGLQVVFMLIGYFAGWTTQPIGRSVGWISNILCLVLLFMGIREKKMENPADFTFGKGWIEGFLISVVASVLFAVFFYIFADMINPEMIDFARSEANKNMATGNMTKEQIEQTKKVMDFMISPTGFAIGTLVSYIFGGAIISLILAPIVKSTGNTTLPPSAATDDGQIAQ